MGCVYWALAGTRKNNH